MVNTELLFLVQDIKEKLLQIYMKVTTYKDWCYRQKEGKSKRQEFHK